MEEHISCETLERVAQKSAHYGALELGEAVTKIKLAQSYAGTADELNAIHKRLAWALLCIRTAIENL